MADPAPAAFLASLAIIAIGWWGRWEVTIAGGMAIAALSAFVAGAPLGETGLPVAIFAAAVTYYRIGEAKSQEVSLRRFRELQDQGKK